MSKRLYTSKEVAIALGFNVRRINKAREQGLIIPTETAAHGGISKKKYFYDAEAVFNYASIIGVIPCFDYLNKITTKPVEMSVPVTYKECSPATVIDTCRLIVMVGKVFVAEEENALGWTVTDGFTDALLYPKTEMKEAKRVADCIGGKVYMVCLQEMDEEEGE